MANRGPNSPKEGMIISTVVAINRNKNSQHAVRWAIDNLRSGDNGIALVHVCTKSYSVSNGDAGEGPTHDELVKQLFLPYRSLCARKGIRAKEVILYDIDIDEALSDFVNANSIRTVVLGTSSRGAIARALKATDVPTSVMKSMPDHCSVYTVNGKGKSNLIKSARGSTCSISSSGSIARSVYFPERLSSISSTNSISHNVFLPGNSSDPVSGPNQDCSSWWTAASGLDGASLPGRSFDDNSGENGREYLELTSSEMPPVSETSSPYNSLNSSDSLNRFAWEKGQGPKDRKPDNSWYSSNEFGHTNQSKKFPVRRIHALQQSNLYANLRGRDLNGLLHLQSESSDISEAESVVLSDVSYEYLDQTRITDSSMSSISSEATDFEDELTRVKLELMQITENYSSDCEETLTAKEQEKDIAQWKLEAARKLEETKRAREAALAMVEKEKQKYKAALEMAERAQRLAELEAEKRKRAELMFKQESEEKHKAMDALRHVPQCRRYTIDEIEAATNQFSDSNKIGEGGYGPVYKATLDHTPVAIKILRSDGTEGQKQFQREVNVLSQMRHPNIVILLGACPEQGSLVYEYMEQGSLECRLSCKNGTPPLPWKTRFQIAAEIATALNFLHQTKPQPLVHRDLKPDNILLDKNYVGKISDVGLSRLVPPSVADNFTQYCMTAAAGTFCYIDPEYQQTGMLGTKSDIYSFGIILLQIITAKPPIGLAYNVERAIEEGKFEDVLDKKVKDWPVEEALSLAKLALKCCELRKKDRPDLDSVILPELVRLRDLGS